MAFGQRWVHGGLVLAVVVLSMCLTVLVLGATRSAKNNWGLPGSPATDFYLKDTRGAPTTLSENLGKTAVLIFTGHNDTGFGTYAELVNGILSAYRDDADVRILGIAYAHDLALFGPGETRPAVLQRLCPELRVSADADGSVARAYRINGTPTLVVVDPEGFIRGRIPLDREGAAIAITEQIQSVRQTETSVRSVVGPLPDD